MFINASCVIGLGLEVKAFREAICGCSSLGCGVRVDMIGRDCDLEISEILLMVDPRDWGVIVWHHCVHVHCNTPKCTLVVFDMFRVYYKLNGSFRK